jgi:ribosomal protein S18 acetylase RimI-like enzyme
MERLAQYLIVPPGPGDATALAEVQVRAWHETYPGLIPSAYLARMSAPVQAERWRRTLNRPHAGDVTLALEGVNQIAGYCSGAVGYGEAEIFTLYLLSEVQGRGLGAHLFQAVARALGAGGAETLDVWVLNGNHRAMGFYARLGGRPSGERPVRGFGGGLYESRFHWSNIAALIGD